MINNPVKRILVVEDDENIREVLKTFLTDEGYHVEVARDGQEGLSFFEPGKEKFSVILSDIHMPVMDGNAFVKKLKESGEDTPIVLMTAYGTINSAVEAMKNGAYDFLTKPIDLDDLKQNLDKALEYSKFLHEEIKDEDTMPGQSGLIAESSAMKRIFGLLSRVARVDSTILILGESGVGKEVIANEIHRRSTRKNKNFIAINCAAIPADLLESELFGHVKGSFTGATAAKRGLFEEAEGGTLFLDEIGDMAPALQAKLLRVLQERRIRPVGSNVTKSLDVRVIAATHRDLRLAIIEGKFREDLFYRLSVVPILIPPLRDRKEDIRSLAIHFAKRASRAINEGYKTFSEEALGKMQSHSWPGNVRELENMVERCLVMCPRNVIKAQDLEFLGQEMAAKSPFEAQETPIVAPAVNSVADAPASSGSTAESFCLKDLERDTLIRALKFTGGKKAEAARLLGIDRKTLHRKEEEYRLKEIIQSPTAY